jgi:hypothetical protein
VQEGNDSWGQDCSSSGPKPSRDDGAQPGWCTIGRPEANMGREGREAWEERERSPSFIGTKGFKEGARAERPPEPKRPKRARNKTTLGTTQMAQISDHCVARDHSNHGGRIPQPLAAETEAERTAVRHTSVLRCSSTFDMANLDGISTKKKLIDGMQAQTGMTAKGTAAAKSI